MACLPKPTPTLLTSWFCPLRFVNIFEILHYRVSECSVIANFPLARQSSLRIKNSDFSGESNMSKLDSSTVFCLFWTLCRVYACSHSSRVRSFHSIFPLRFVVIFSPRSLFKHYPPFPLLRSFLCVSLFGTRCFLVMSFCSFFAFKPIHWARFFNIQVCEYVYNCMTYPYVSLRIFLFHPVPSFFPTKLTTQSWPLRAHKRHRSFTTSLVSPTCFAPLAPLTAAFSLAELMLKESSPSDQGASTLVFDAPKSQRHGHHILNRGKKCRSSCKIYKSVWELFFGQL